MPASSPAGCPGFLSRWVSLGSSGSNPASWTSLSLSCPHPPYQKTNLPHPLPLRTPHCCPGTSRTQRALVLAASSPGPPHRLLCPPLEHLWLLPQRQDPSECQLSPRSPHVGLRRAPGGCPAVPVRHAAAACPCHAPFTVYAPLRRTSLISFTIYPSVSASYPPSYCAHPSPASASDLSASAPRMQGPWG